MTCESCTAAREAPAHPFYSIKCVYCGARLIWTLGRMHNRRREEIIERRRAVLADWMAWGHPEQRLRELAKAGRALEPEAPPPVKKGR